jgi:hypothetical protein
MGLQEDTVDLFEFHAAGLVAHRFDERAQTQIAGAVQQPFAGTNDQRQVLGGERVVLQAGAIQLIRNELFDGFGLAREELVADDTEKSFDFNLRCSIPYGRVMEQAADARVSEFRRKIELTISTGGRKCKVLNARAVAS